MEMNSKVSGSKDDWLTQLGPPFTPPLKVQVNGLLLSSELPPVVARMRKFLRLGSLTLQVLSATWFFWLPLAGGLVSRVVPLLSPKRPMSWVTSIPLSA